MRTRSPPRHRHPSPWSDDRAVEADIAAARAARADFVVPFMHWGWEGYPTPSRRQRRLARGMIDAGATEREILTAALDDIGLPHPAAGGAVLRGRTQPR